MIGNSFLAVLIPGYKVFKEKLFFLVSERKETHFSLLVMEIFYIGTFVLTIYDVEVRDEKSNNNSSTT